MTITDGVSNKTFTTSWTVDIPTIVGSNTAYLGFTGGTGSQTASQKIETWTFVSSASAQPAATPVIMPGTGTYTTAQTVSITDGTSGAKIYYTLDGSQPTAASTPYAGSFVVSSTTTVKAIATATNFSISGTATSLITIQNGINFASGFTAGGMVLNGSTTLNGTRLRLTDGGLNEASSSWYPVPVNVQTFTTDFNFQITAGLNGYFADGFTFTIQGNNTSALGPGGGGLGYGPDNPAGQPGIANSVAVKFDLSSNAGEGSNSTGLYTNGASPTTPATALGGGVNLHSGDVFHVHITYDGTTLTMTITDTVNTTQTFTTSWPINIPATTGGNTAYLGFTGGTGGLTAIQDILNWRFSSP